MKRVVLFPVVCLFAIGCAETVEAEKPASDPDLTVLSGKADRVSNYWTDIQGELTIGTRIQESIDFPSYYFGRTAELRMGQRYQVELATNRKSVVRLYGPSTGQVDGYPVFGAPLVKADTRKNQGKHASSFAFDVPADGVYMLVYGPQNVWQAHYDIDVTCLGGCAVAAPCEGDWECKAGEFCGDNGVRCVRAPCDANYNVCQQQVSAGDVCTRDPECQSGAACREGVCGIETCTTDADCANGFCGCADGSCATRICKDYAAEGESCGGFRMANLVRHCSAELSCVAPYTIIADIPGHCGELTTVAEVLADPTGFDGRFIAIQGVFDPNAAACTKIGCSDANPCCNQCIAQMRVYDHEGEFGTEGIYLSGEGVALGCGGNQCTWRDHCAVEPGNYWVAGWFRLDDGGSPRLDIVVKYAY